MYLQKKELLQKLKDYPGAYDQYECLDERWRQRFLDFCAGKKTLPLSRRPIRK